ncbi:MAG: 30S ribosomal protein S3 [Candidatus Brocadiaceae bacterium]|jgi:small subunit ribosomal protein S3
MGQKVRPTSLRLGITEDWRSHWVADKKTFGDYLVEDQQIRTYTKNQYYYAGISRIEIERTRDSVHVTVRCARPGLVIGRRGVEVERLKNALDELTGRSVEISVEEVRDPQLDAQLIAEDVAQQIERRTSFRRAIRRAAEMTMNSGAEGIKIEIAGRLGGSDMTRREKVIEGRFPLQTLRAQIQYGFTEARTKFGHIGVKVWVNRGLLPPGERIDREVDEDALNA